MKHILIEPHGPWRSPRRLLRTVVTVGLTVRASSAPASGAGAGAGIADAMVPNARAATVAIFMKENMVNRRMRDGCEVLRVGE